MSLCEELQAHADRIDIVPRRLLLDTPNIKATAPMIRGTWGAALHGLDGHAYGQVFQGGSQSNARVPTYLLRPARPDPVEAPAVEWFLFADALSHDDVLLRAWDIASGMGLGPARSRFHIRHILPLNCHGEALEPDRPPHPWRLGHAQWPLGQPAEPTPCRLRFVSPLRMLRRGRLISTPTLADIVVGALRRLEAYAPPDAAQALRHLRPTALAAAHRTARTRWVGERQDLERYSASQRAKLDLRGFVGHLDLPAGPGGLWPLLAAATWLHVGKTTVMGLGQLVIEPLP